jgi:CubicO group peptidase (beta-lactamase class C family)
MQSVQIATAGNKGYGFGLMVQNDDHGEKIISHDGVVAGFNAYMAFNPATRIGVILLRNCDNALPAMEPPARDALLRLVKAN